MPVSWGCRVSLPLLAALAPVSAGVLNTLSGLVCSVRNNTCFVDAVAELARRAGCKLTICPQAENRNDRWIQVPRPLGRE